MLVPTGALAAVDPVGAPKACGGELVPALLLPAEVGAEACVCGGRGLGGAGVLGAAALCSDADCWGAAN